MREVLDALLATAAALGLAGLWLVAVSWRLRSVLALPCGVLGIASAIAAGTAGRTGSAASDYLAGSLAVVLIGTVLLVLGQAVQRLLDRGPSDLDGDGHLDGQHRGAGPRLLRGRVRPRDRDRTQLP